MDTIKQVLMRRDGFDSDEADQLIEEAREALAEYLEAGDLELAEDICAEYFGLEPDFLMELLPV